MVRQGQLQPVVPSIREVNEKLHDAFPDQHLFVDERPKKYLRGKLNTVWVNVICGKHGSCQNPKRWFDLKNGRAGCPECSDVRMRKQRRLTDKEIKRRIDKNSTELGLCIQVKKITYPDITLECAFHGPYTTSIDKAINRSQLCRSCGFQRCSAVNMTPLEDKRAKFKKRYPNATIKILDQAPKRKIRVRCTECGSIFLVAWGNLYSGGTGCCECYSPGDVGYNRPLSIDEVERRLIQHNLELVGTLTNTHKKCPIKCSNCGTIKDIKPNQVFFGKGGFSCVCTQSIPDYCRDLIAYDLRSVDRHLVKESLGFGKVIPDIILPTIRTIVEVKYGESCFGKKNGSSYEKDRYQHVRNQYGGYRKTDYRLIYIIAARMEELVGIPKFLNYCEHYDLETLGNLHLSGRRAIKRGTEAKLMQLYRAPVTVRGVDFADNPEYKHCRSKLIQYLEENDGVYPSQSMIRKALGISNRYMDRALGLGRRVNNQQRIAVLKEIYGVKASTERKFYTNERRRKIPIPSISEVNKTLQEVYPHQNLRILKAPRRYMRGKGNNIWIEVICSIHGPCPKPKRWIDVQKGWAGCRKCTVSARGKNQRIPIPSIDQVNAILREKYPDQQLRVIDTPRRYERTGANRIWINVTCMLHGPCPVPKAWHDLKAGRAGCRKCSMKRFRGKRKHK